MTRFWVACATALVTQFGATFTYADDTPNSLAGHAIAITADILKSQVVAIRIPGVSGSSATAGSGVIVAEKARELLVATAGHVLASLDKGSNVEVTVFIDRDHTVTVQGIVASDDSDIPNVDGPKFVRIPLLDAQPELFANIVEDIHVGDFVGTLGRAGSWAPDVLAGRITAAGPGSTIEFKDAGIEPSYSGSPLMIPQGIVGIVRERLDPSAESAISISEVQYEFDNLFRAGGWQSLLNIVQRAPTPGYLRLTRTDSIPSTMALRNADRMIVPVTPDVLTAVIPGIYSLIASAGDAGSLACVSPDIVIHESETYVSSVLCKYDVIGAWSGLSNSTLTLTPTGAGTLAATFAGDPIYSGTGNATFDGHHLHLWITRSDHVLWDALLEVDPSGLRGSISLLTLGSGGAYPLWFTRPLQ